MSTTQTASADTDPPKSHRLFRLYDPEVVAVMTILVGLFQMLLAAPIYHVSTDLRLLFFCPLCAGFVSVIAGSLGMASERTPSRQMLKKCFIAGLAALGVSLIAVFVYCYSASNVPIFPPCADQVFDTHLCPQVALQNFYKALSGMLLFFDVATLVLHCFLSFSAFKGLKTH